MSGQPRLLWVSKLGCSTASSATICPIPKLTSVDSLRGFTWAGIGHSLRYRDEFLEETQGRFVVESGERPESVGQVAEVVARWRLAVQVTESFPLAEAVELGRDDRSGVPVGGPGEL